MVEKTGQRDDWAQTRGTSAHVCVDVDALRARRSWTTIPGPGASDRVLNARSGELVAGNFYELLGRGTPGDPGFVAKIYWVPRDPEVAKTEALTVTARYLGDARQPTVTVGFGGDGTWQSSGTGTGYFWASGTPMPRKGRWRLTATALGVWGCFKVTA